MNDLFIQTTIMASVTFLAVIGAILYLKKPQAQFELNEDEELKKELITVQEELDLEKSNNSILSSKLAAAEVTVKHLSNVEEHSNELEEQKRLVESLLSESKAELSRISAHLEEKNDRYSTLFEESTILSKQVKSLQGQITQLSSEKAQLAEKLKGFVEVQGEVKQLKSALAEKDLKITELTSQKSALLESKKGQQEKIELLERTEQRFIKEFENTANKLFKEKTGEMSQQNKLSLDSLLSPLKTQIGVFSKQVTEVYTNEAKERHALKQEVHSLKALNEQMTKEAVALTKALKGDNKKQGTWGEVVLERVLQESGLRLGHEYVTQVSLKNEDGSSFKPDVIVHLPDEKDVIIDSKMVLTAYERYFNSEDDATRQQALKEHINAIKNHIKQLTTKNYHDLHGVQSLDYVLMFIPVEPAFNLAVEKDSELIQLALERNIMLVSPTNLMVALKTINNMWRVEYQNQNAQEIAKKAGAIYDKLVGFVDDMKKLGSHLERAEGSYGEAMKKLGEGRGNLIQRAEKMKGLRIGNNKDLPPELIEKADLSVLEEKPA